MGDRAFEVSLSSLVFLVLLCVTTAVVLAIAGFSWLDVDTPLLVFLTILIGLIVIVTGGLALLHFWGKSYMARE